MGDSMIFELGGSEGQGGDHRGANKNCCYRTFNWGKLAASDAFPLTTGNKKKLNVDYAVLWHISLILHKLYAATMIGKGREDTYNFSHDDWGRQPGAGHKAQGQLPPAIPPEPPMSISENLVGAYFLGHAVACTLKIESFIERIVPESSRYLSIISFLYHLHGNMILFTFGWVDLCLFSQKSIYPVHR